jgi:hypothetical protein
MNPQPKLRYVVLRHEGIENPHYDLMIETTPGSPLATWRLPHWPPLPGDVPESLGDHRRVYLEYEGPVSGNRGSVRRVASGECGVISEDSRMMKICTDEGSEVSLPKKSDLL